MKISNDIQLKISNGIQSSENKIYDLEAKFDAIASYLDYLESNCVQTIDGKFLEVVEAPAVVFPDGTMLLNDGTYYKGNPNE